MAFQLSNVTQNPIIQMNMILLIVGYLLYKKYNRVVFLFLVFIVFICNEVINYFTGCDIYSSEWRTEIVYSGESFDSITTDEWNSINSNMTEGYFKSGECIPWQESERNRFDHFIEILDIKNGDYVLDCGCGYGGLVEYLRDKDINAYGITITKSQYEKNRSNIGDYYYYGDYTIFNPELVGKFDHIILPGSLEHTFGGNPKLMRTYQNKYEKMKEMFAMMKQYFKSNSLKKKILTTTLHINPKFKDTYQAFVTERYYGGSYPLINEYSVSDSLLGAGYDVLSNEDYTWHYYYASYCNLSHFGNPFDIGIPMTLFALPFYPHILYAYFYWNDGYWMWQFDGKMHERRTTEECDPSQECDLTFEPDIDKRPTTLFYTIAQLN